MVLWEGRRVKGERAKRGTTGWHHVSFIPTSPNTSHGIWHMVSAQKLLVELNSLRNTGYSLQIPECQVGGHLHLLPEKLCLQEKKEEQHPSRDSCLRT